MANDPSEPLESQIADLTDRVRRLEDALYGASLPAAKPISFRFIPEALPDTPPEPSPRNKTKESLEERIGAHFFNRIGIFAVLIGMAWFLKYAFENQWIGPAGRVIIGLITGAALIAWSEWFRGRGHKTFSFSLKAVGTGVLYLSLWAAYDIYHLIPAGVAFIAMILVTAWNAFICWIQDSELLALFALVGGFLTPILSSTGENHQIVLFTYLLVLDIAIVTLIALRKWSRLAFLAFLFTAVLMNGWADRFYSDEVFWLTTSYLVVFATLFAVSPFFMEETEDLSLGNRLNWNALTVIILPLVNAALTFAAFYDMLGVPSRRWARPWASVCFGAFYILMMRGPEYLSRILPLRNRITGQSRSLPFIHLTLAITFLTIAINIAAEGYWIATGWFIEGAVLMWSARQARSLLLRGLATIVMLLGVATLFAIIPTDMRHVVFNPRFAAYLAGIISFGFVAILAYREIVVEPPVIPSDRSAQFSEVFQWSNIAGVSLLAMNGLILLSVWHEIRTYWTLNNHSWLYEQFSYTIWLLIFGGSLLFAGFKKRASFIRWQALAVIAFSILKIFLSDISTLSQGYRIASFLGLGILLLVTSFAYQRDWLGLRAEENPETVEQDTVA